MALPEHIEAARRISTKRLQRQRGIAFKRQHIDEGLALSRRLRAMGNGDDLQREVAEKLKLG